MEEPALQKDYVLVETSDYLMAYPGSYWDLVSPTSGDTIRITCENEYDTSRFKKWNTQSYSDWVIVPVYDGGPLFYDAVIQGGSGGSGDLVKIVAASGSSTISRGTCNTPSSCYSHQLYFSEMDSLVVNGVTYYDLRKASGYVYSGTSGQGFTGNNKYYAKGIGVVRIDNAGAPYELVDYFINN